MRTFIKSLLLFGSIFAAAYLARILLAPDVAPIGEGEDPNWQIQIAFLLKSVQNVGLFGIVVVVLIALPGQVKEFLRSTNPH